MVGPDKQTTTRTLILDDDLEFLISLEAATRNFGHQVAAFTDSGQALRHALNVHFDLLVTNLRMPGLDGLQALEFLKRRNPDLKSLVFSGQLSENDSLRALQLKINEHLRKPFSQKDYIRMLERLDEQMRQSRAARQQRHQLLELALWNVEQVTHQHQLSQNIRRLLLGRGQAPEQALQNVLAILCSEHQSSLPVRVAACIPPDVVEIARKLPQDLLILRQQAANDTTPEQPLQTDQHRHLLSLAQAMEEAGQPGAARQAYRELAESGASRESARARLRLARLSFEQQNWDAAAQAAVQCVDLSARLGPLGLQEVSVDAAFLVAPTQPSQAIEWLQAAAASAQLLGLHGRRALARLGLSRLTQQAASEGDLRTLLQPHNLELLLDSCWWSVPYLFTPVAGPTSEIRNLALTTLLRERPATLQRALHQFSTTAKLRLLQLRPYHESLKTLSTDMDSAVARAAHQQMQKGQSQALPGPMRMRTLGCNHLYLGEQKLPEQTLKKNRNAFFLLVYLACAEGRPIAEELVAEEFWPEEGEQARRNLSQLWSTLQRVLPQPESLQRTPLGLQLNPKMPWWLDYAELRRQLREGREKLRSGKAEAGAELLRSAAQLYGGPFLEGCFLEFAVNARQQLEEQLSQGLLDLAQYDLGRGASEGAREMAEQILQIDPAKPEAYRLGLEAQLQAGRVTEAERLLQRAQRVLPKEAHEPLLELLHQANL
jgi:DNA-binding SARP family transcriptional activator/DNA-binding response OmpR family regulator